MKLAAFVVRNILHRKFLSLLTVSTVAVTVGLIVFLILMQESVEEGAAKGYGPFDLVVGAEGSETQLVLNTFYHVGAPVGNISLDVLDALQKHNGVDKAYGMTTGDNYNGYPIVGIDPEYFATRYGNQKLSAGNLYGSLGEVVIGSHAARALGVSVGDTFKGGHGLVEEAGHSFDAVEEHHDEHEEFQYKIVGILPPLHTPDDRAVFTTMDYAWAVHEESGEHREVTAVLVKPRSIGGVQEIKLQYDGENGVQAAYTSKAVADVLEVVDLGSEMIGLVTMLCILLAASSLLLSLTAAANERKKDVGLLRLIGKSRGYVFMTFIGEGMALVICGLIAGIGIGHLGGYLFQDLLFDYTGIKINALLAGPSHLLLILGTIVLGGLAMMIPSFKMYRLDPLQLFKA
ncbi:FtsX-like permease family protein [Paenibacillus oenotherae]|uniref:Putative hemin transport system permease protein HrtB n=1 Tax=Paenibacillus oenotherae TaxID=1435645 RepID=A0ABS7D8A6_9BACL|nr:FtsX-like permease family protein [Paenibacillus oenotherae]MBW7476167.1 FtsX-like permease family protein [Paenibacillus oenotherae]